MFMKKSSLISLYCLINWLFRNRHIFELDLMIINESELKNNPDCELIIKTYLDLFNEEEIPISNLELVN